MPTFASLTDERRLAELRALAILDTAPEAEYDDLASLAAAVCRSPVAAVNFVDGERHFTKAIVGMPAALGGSVRNEVSFCAATVQAPEGVLVVPDTHADRDWQDHPLVTGPPHVGFYAGVAIVSGNERVGVICTFGDEARPVDDTEQAALATLARQASGLLELRRHNAELRDLALTDPLTGLGNRTALHDRLEEALDERTAGAGDIGVLFCDVDGFKAINDRYGHEAGDRLLCDLARHLRSVVRASDSVARIAGDEFVIVCTSMSSPEDLELIAWRLADTSPIAPLPDGRPAPRISVGAIVARVGDDAADVLRGADRAMYAVKAGR